MYKLAKYVIATSLKAAEESKFSISTHELQTVNIHGFISATEGNEKSRNGNVWNTNCCLRPFFAFQRKISIHTFVYYLLSSI